MTDRLLLGTYGSAKRLRISKPGFDVKANLATENLIFDSDLIPTAFVVQTGTVFLQLAQQYWVSQGTYYFPNMVTWPSLGFIPATVVLEQRSNSTWRKTPMPNHRTEVRATSLSFWIFGVDTEDPGDWTFYSHYAILSYPEGGVFA